MVLHNLTANSTFQNNSAAFSGGAMLIASTRSALINGSILLTTLQKKVEQQCM